MTTTVRRSRSALAVLAGADLTTLAALRPTAALLHSLAAPHRWVAAVGADAASAQLVSAALWLVAAWLGLGLTASAAAALPGAIGRSAAGLARCTLPRAIHRLAAGAVGLGVLCSPATSLLASAATPNQHDARAPASSRPAPVWPTDDPVPAPHWPTSAPLPSRPHPTPSRPGGDTPAGRPASTVVVAVGDSLWRIAAVHLPEREPSARRIAGAWPRWYAANRAVIGVDPNHLSPGQVLAVPGPSPGQSLAQSPAQEDPS